MRVQEVAAFFSESEKPYNAWLHWSATMSCNLKCSYCFVNTKKPGLDDVIDIDKVVVSLDSLDKAFKISFTGGEPFLIKNFVDLCTRLSKNHYLEIVTNLVTGDVEGFSEKINSGRVERITASFHLEELEKHNLLDVYIDNFLLLKKKGFSIICLCVAFPPFAKQVEKYKALLKEKGITLFFTHFIGEFDGKKYPGAYNDKELRVFGLTRQDFNKHMSKGMLCNAGFNVGVVNEGGEVFPCDAVRPSLGSLFSGFKFKDSLIKCPVEFCGCPLNEYNLYLFRLAQKKV